MNHLSCPTIEVWGGWTLGIEILGETQGSSGERSSIVLDIATGKRGAQSNLRKYCYGLINMSIEHPGKQKHPPYLPSFRRNDLDFLRKSSKKIIKHAFRHLF